jgi:hypothetical protein
MKEIAYKRLTAATGLTAAVCAVYSIYLTVTAPDSFQDLANSINVSSAENYDNAINDIGAALRKVAERSIDEGVRNVAVPARLDEPAKISINESQRFDTRDNFTTTVALNNTNPGDFYATVGGERGLFRAGDTKLIDAETNCYLHFTSLNYDEQTIGVQVFCNEASGE